MRIVYLFNLQKTVSEHEAEFDRPDTVESIQSAFMNLGHDVLPMDASDPIETVISRIRTWKPDLVFNTVEGSRGELREALYPAIFEECEIPFTGSSAATCALTLDKNLTKSIIAQHGILVPRGKFIRISSEIDHMDLHFPVIAKPNFEGSSMGISIKNIVESQDDLTDRIASLLRQYPQGILLEEYIDGIDITVPYLECASPETFGVLPPCRYIFSGPARDRKFQIYDFELKAHLYNFVDLEVPAKLPLESLDRLRAHTKTIVDRLSIRDFARADFRVTSNGDIYFLEINALPSLEAGASLYVSADQVGLHSQEAVLSAILNSASKRIPAVPPSRLHKRPTVGLIYNLMRVDKSNPSASDAEAEFDLPETIDAVKDSLHELGVHVMDLEATNQLPHMLDLEKPDLVFNMAEGFSGPSREAQVPTLLEFLNIPYTGSNPKCLTLCLDKHIAKNIVGKAGIATAPGFILDTDNVSDIPKCRYPVIAKPVAEGSSKGIHPHSVVHHELELRQVSQSLISQYSQPVLVEEFLSGREFSVGLLGEKGEHVLPILEVVYLDAQEKFPVYSYIRKVNESGIRYEVPANLTIDLQQSLKTLAKRAFKELGCRDFARIDFRLDSHGCPHFIECNPLPGLCPDFSDFCYMAKAQGLTYTELIAEILKPALIRCGLADSRLNARQLSDPQELIYPPNH